MTDIEPISFTYKNTKQLIQLVQARPCLWDRQATDYKDRLARDRAWGEIFEELDPQFKECSATTKHDIGLTITKKWYNIRDSYVKSLKPDYLGRRGRQYIHADLLRFLDDCYVEKITTSFLHKQRRNPDEECDELETEVPEDTDPWDQKVFVTLDEEPAQKRARTEHSTEQREKTNDEDIISVLSNLIQKEEDEDRAFFKSITPSVKKLSEDSKFEFRIEVLKLIKSLRAKDRGESKTDESSDSE